MQSDHGGGRVGQRLVDLGPWDLEPEVPDDYGRLPALMQKLAGQQRARSQTRRSAWTRHDARDSCGEEREGAACKPA
jgi:hypothetical protein